MLEDDAKVPLLSDSLVAVFVVVVAVVVVLIFYCHDGPWPIRHNE